MHKLFKDVGGRPVPVFDETDARVADGVTLFSLEQAAAHFSMSEADLSASFDAFFQELIPPDAPLVNPGAAAATIASPTRAALLRRFMYPDLSPEHVEQFLRQCEHLNLDPWCRQIYPKTVDVERPGGGGGPELVVLLAIGGLRQLAHRTGQFAGVDAPVFTYGDHERFPVSAEITVYRFVHGQRTPFKGRALWDEFYPGGETPTLWDEKPTRCLETPAEAQALRRAFDLDGLHAPEEFDRRRRRAGRPAGPSAGVSPSASLTVDGYRGDIEELDLPTTPHQFRLRLTDHGADAGKQALVLKMLKARYSRLYMEDEARFYAVAYAHLAANPAAFGLMPLPAAALDVGS